MYKLYSVSQANGLIPQIEQAVAEVRTALADLGMLKDRAAATRPMSVEARDLMMESAFLVSQLQDGKQALERMGVQISDMETGTVGIPAQVGAELVWLTWQPGQPAITHYRRMDRTEAMPLPGIAGEAAAPLSPPVSTAA